MSTSYQNLKNIYNYYIFTPLTSQIQQQKFNTIIEFAKPDASKLTTRLIKKIYEYIDLEYFDGCISLYLIDRYDRNLKCRINGSLRTTAGRMYSSGIDGHSTPVLEISDKVFNDLFQNGETQLVSGGLRIHNWLEALIRTIEHELCHLILFTCDLDNATVNSGHGSMFKKFINHVFGHTDYRHELLSGCASVVDQLKAELKSGFIIEYKLKDEIHQGKITDLRKRYLIVDDKVCIPYTHVIKVIEHNELQISQNKIAIKEGEQITVHRKQASDMFCKVLRVNVKTVTVDCGKDGNWKIRLSHLKKEQDLWTSQS
jgi:hypothetical protein